MEEYQMNEASLQEIERWGFTFRYQLLDRLRTDCNYYLGFGNRNSRFLWAGNAAMQIAYMTAIWNSFPQDQKPEWLDLTQIYHYEVHMKGENQGASQAELVSGKNQM